MASALSTSTTNTMPWSLAVLGHISTGRLRDVEARYEVKSGDSAQLMDTLIFLRRDVVYHLLLKTTGQHYKTDSGLFGQIRAGFRLLPFPKGACVNQ